MHRGKCHADADLQQELDSNYTPTTYMYINFVCFHDETKKKKNIYIYIYTRGVRNELLISIWRLQISS